MTVHDSEAAFRGGTEEAALLLLQDEPVRAVIHAANCRCHAGQVRQCDEVKALQIDQDYPHFHPYVDPKCAALRGDKP